MSVINQMLRDLDQRQGNQPSSQPVPPMMGKANNQLPRQALLVVIVLVVIAFLYFAAQKYVFTVSSETPVNEITKSEPSNHSSVVDEEVQSVPLQSESSMTSNESQQMVSEQTLVKEIESSPVAESSSESEFTVNEPVINTESNPAVSEVIVEQSEPASKIVKTNPNESLRVSAQTLYDQLSMASGSSLTMNQ